MAEGFKNKLKNDTRSIVLILIIIASIALCIFFWSRLGLFSLKELYVKIDEWPDGRVEIAETAGVDSELTQYGGSRLFIYSIMGFFGQILGETTALLFIAALFSTYFAGRIFKNKNPQQISSPKSAFRIELIHCYFVIGVTLLLAILGYMWVRYGFNLWSELLPVGYDIRCLAVWLYLALASMALPLLLAFLFQDLTKTLFANVALLLAIYIIPGGGSAGGLFGGKLLDWYPLNMMQKDILWQETLTLTAGEWMGLLLIPAALILGTAVAAHFLFQRVKARS